MTKLKMAFIVFALICCVTTCSKLAYNPEDSVIGETEIISDPAPAIEAILISGSIYVIMDHTTGCQYIQTLRGMYPRMNADGTQYCIDNLNLDETNTDTSIVQSI